MEFGQAVAIGAAVILRLAQLLLCVGGTRSHSAAGAAARLLLDFAVATLALWAIGWIWIPSAGFMHIVSFSTLDSQRDTSQIVFLALAPLLLCSGTIVGATQDRARPMPILVLTAVLAAIVIPLMMQIEMRMGSALGKADFNIGIAAIAGGTAALTAAWRVRPRKSKFNRDLSVNVLPGHNVPLQFVGIILLMLAMAAYTGQAPHAVLAASAATLAGAAFGRLMFSKVDTSLMLAASLAGIVTTGTMSGQTPQWAAVAAGLIAGGATPWVLMKIETQFRIDDAAGMAAGVLTGGVVGLLVTPLSKGTFVHRLQSLTGNILLTALAAALAIAAALAVCQFFKSRNALRLTEDQEYEGVDLAEFDLNAYPDFQQTMIKSHHLRQL